MRVLITGKNSYIGESFERFASNKGYEITTVDVQHDDYTQMDFKDFDAVVHVAAIVHKKDNEFSMQEYFKVNTKLPFDIATKAKNEGVSQFVFLSTMSVYGINNGVISKDTPLDCVTPYGISKMQAEQRLKELESDNFKVTIIRPPMVYGKGCKGNYNHLVFFAKKFRFFPDYPSQRSMIYIDNLSSFITKTIDEKLSGVYCPQDKEYVRTADMVQLIAQNNSKNIKLTKIFNPLITLCIKLKIKVFCKAFGSLIYDDTVKTICDTVDLETAIKETEKQYY